VKSTLSQFQPVESRILLLAAFCTILTGCSRPPDFPALEAQGTPLVAAIEKYRDSHGVYPPTLEAAGLTPPQTRFRPWRYDLRPDGSFQIAIGDYGRDGFVLFWTSQNKSWYRDT
jgi:hypothetical protein